MLVFLHPRVLSRVAGFPVASPCLWGKLENLSFSNVSKQVVMLFCVADVALSDIPTCLITCGKYQNWRKSRTKCSFWCSHVSRLESLVFLWRRRVYGGSSVANCEKCTPHCLVSSHWFSCGVAVSTLHTPQIYTLGSLVRNAGFSESTCLHSSRWFSLWRRTFYGGSWKTSLLLECIQAGCHVTWHFH